MFVTGISGSGADVALREVIVHARSEGHEHTVELFDVGEVMHQFAREDDPDINWNRILDSDETALRHLRALAFQQLGFSVQTKPKTLYVVDLHLSFRWRAYLTRGFEPHVLDAFKNHVRCFINVIEDLPKVQERLRVTGWGERRILELLVWRDEELFLTDLFSDTSGRVDSFAVAIGEPPSVIERLIWHPEYRKIYLSFPITAIQEDTDAIKEIEDFRDRAREFLVIFDPWACRDYEETYKRPEMRELREEIGETTVDRDFRFIDQADAVVVYFPRKVPSKGVDAEMRHAQRTGKDIYLYAPEELGGGPFAVPPNHFRSDVDGFVDLLRERLGPAGTEPLAFGGDRG